MRRHNFALYTGLFILILLSGTLALGYWLGHFERQRNPYIVETKASVSGLAPESTVFYRGIAVGKVLRIQFDPQDSGTILVNIEVDKTIVLTKAVYATLRLKGVTGLSQIQLDEKVGGAEILPPGDAPEHRIPLVPSMTDRLLDSSEDLLKKADHLMQRLSILLSDENEKNITDILVNLKSLSDKLIRLQAGVDRALNDFPVLSKEAKKTMGHIDFVSDDARKTLKHIDVLAEDLRHLTAEVHTLSRHAGELVHSGNQSAEQITQTTLPKINQLLVDVQAASQRIQRTATALDNNPQALLLGPDARQDSGPGEPGYQETP